MTDWYQQALTPPEAVQINIRIGVIPSTDHVQCLVELVDPLTKIQLGMWSQPHSRMRDLPDVIAWALEKAQTALRDSVDPF